ncbi:MarR family winged helix-turn-helix transcriptional regulator [Sphingomonas sp.]|uniref:MarR family winged helix-turn-helix transcriptional regulator n=1 Tax=Sphingomonas sp. TaxID=28214 RepID=UPI0035A86064
MAEALAFQYHHAVEIDLTSPTLKALRRILRASDLGSRQLAAVTGLTPSQLLVLHEIEQRGETTASVLASTLQFSQATITNIVDRLEASMLVKRERSQRDKRQIILQATASGRATIEKAPDLLQARFSDQFPALPAWEQAMILAALDRLGNILGADALDAAPLLDAGAIDRATPTP